MKGHRVMMGGYLLAQATRETQLSLHVVDLRVVRFKQNILNI